MSTIDPEIRVSYDRSVSLIVSGFVSVPFPSGSYEVSADGRVFWEDILAEALARHGLADRTLPIAQTIRDLCEPHFRKVVEELQELQEKALREAEEL